MTDKISLQTHISGISFSNPFLNASGCLCTNGKELDSLALSSCGAFVSKSSSLQYRSGNVRPRLRYDIPHGSINSMGVPNLGFSFYQDWAKSRPNPNKPFIQSLMPLSTADIPILLFNLEKNKTTTKNLVELNLSCPNISGKKILAYDFDAFEKTLQELNQFRLQNKVGLKLPPYYEEWQFDKLCNIILRNSNNVNFITTINSIVNGLLVDIDSESTLIRPKDGLGGIGGSYCLPTALANVREIYKRVGDKIDIIGCGGITSGREAFAHLLCGARAVAIGTQLWKEGLGCFNRINTELREIMKNKNYTRLEDFQGKLKVAKQNSREKFGSFDLDYCKKLI